jgi:sugar phosphate isomerase/epimerase
MSLPSSQAARRAARAGPEGLPPRFSLCSNMLPETSLEEDIALIAAAGADGIGVCEGKLIAGEESRQARVLAESGLAASVCIPDNISPLPADDAYPGPADLDERVEAMGASIRRLAAFDPAVIVVLTGSAIGRDPADARKIIVEGLREAARVGAEHDIELSLETIPADPALDLSTIETIPEAVELIEEIAAPNLGLCWDACNLGHTTDVIELTERHAGIVNSVHVADLNQPRGPVDRRFPGDGALDLPALLAALRRGGYDGWYDLEVLAKDGLEFDGGDAIWRLPPVEIVRRGREGMAAVWAASH